MEKIEINRIVLIEDLNIIWDLLNKRRNFEAKRNLEIVIDKLREEENGI